MWWESLDIYNIRMFALRQVKCCLIAKVSEALDWKSNYHKLLDSNPDTGGNAHTIDINKYIGKC